MSTESPDNAPTAAVRVEFLQYHQPALKDGLYHIKVVQNIQSNETGQKKVPPAAFEAERSFFVAGERFTLQPADIQAVFPPDGSLGEHSNVLPHVVLTRSTLPWERLADHAREDVPWLALLLFDDEEKPAPSIVTLGQLLQPSDQPARFPGLTLDPGQTEGDKVTVIDVQRRLLASLLPGTLELQTTTPPASELALLAHVRQNKDADDRLVGDELAVVICNRLPKKGALSTVHLVSLEGRCEGGGFDYQGAGEDDLVRLVSLKSWSFACADQKQNFRGLLMHLNAQHSEPGLLRLPATGDAEADAYLASGFVPLPHTLRQSAKTVSSYHGPLIPGENQTEIELPVGAADQLVRYNPRYGMFDVSYAAAWELGRLLALQSKQFSVSLYNWKRENVQRLKQAEQQLLHQHLPVQAETSGDVSTPPDIVAWFDDLGVLRGVPFNYLVPDERMLPAESIRFFRLDHQWVDCLLDGAFSIGRTTKSDQEVQPPADAAAAGESLSGFLLRSNVVSGWPGLLVDAFDAGGLQLESRRTERLSENVLICILAGVVQQVDLHQKPEMLHFGFDVPDDQPDSLCKTLRDDAGQEEGPTLTEIPWRDAELRVVNVGGLASSIQQLTKLESFTSAQCALHMIEGVEKVTLRIKGL
jgi:hypothetical protein